MEHFTSVLKGCLVAILFAWGSISMAQPGDVDGISARLVLFDANTIEMQLMANAPWDQSDGIVNLTFAIRWDSDAGATLGSPTQLSLGDPQVCMLQGMPLAANSGIDNVDNAGFRYRGYNSTGTQFPAQCAFPADQWIPYAHIPVSGLTGCTTFEIVVSDAYTSQQQVNSDWFISIGGTDITDNSPIVGPGVQMGDCDVDCEGVTGGSALPGTACDDGDPTTGNDVWTADCVCEGELIDCEGIAGGTDLPGTACDDGDPTTGNDMWTADCVCEGELIDCEGVAGGTDLPGTACDDGEPTTGNDMWTADCVCEGELIDCEGIAGGPALPGTACDDGDPSTGNDMWTAACECEGEFIDCEGVAGGSALPGTVCNDGDPNTTDDTWTANCECQGTIVLPDDCLGVPGGPAQPGTACDDNDPTTGNDMWTNECECVGMLIDCEGVAGGSALPGTACDDGDPTTGDDTWTAACECEGEFIDCEGVAGGPALPGTACDDGDPSTGNDMWTATCECEGEFIDCEGVAGGSALPGTACDDGDPDTMNDTWTVACTCEGTIVLEDDCLGVPGGPAQPGTACDDGDPTTGDDTWSNDCVCEGDLIDCEGVAGGTALPGTTCDDGDPDTSNDVWTVDCVCEGSPVLEDDCLGVPGGPAQPGTACDDGDPTTGDDTWNNECVCEGLLIDCEGVAGGPALPGTACDDGDACTTGDVLGLDCTCAGTFADDDGDGTCNAEDVCPNGPEPGTPCDDGDPNTVNDMVTENCECMGDPGIDTDCLGVPGGPAQPGTACDDGDPTTGNDTWSNECVCEGLLIDCLGLPGGTALPGTPCDDEDATTENDVWSTNCECKGTPIGDLDCLGVPGGPAMPGTACDDEDPSTINDMWSPNCVCMGTPTGDCTEILTLELQTDANGDQTSWEIVAQGSEMTMCEGSGYPDNAVVTDQCCVPEGCYILRVFDSAGDGMASGTMGGYVLRTEPDDERVIDNSHNFLSGSVSAISGDQGFCLPMGEDHVIPGHCDKMFWESNEFVVASLNSAVSAEWIPNSPNSQQDNDSGYEFWFFDPNGSYSYMHFRSHATSHGFGSGAARAAHLRINNWAVINHIPENVMMNVKVRGVVNGVPMEWGPACRFMIDPVAAQCPPTKLNDIPYNQYYSCGQTRMFGQGNYVSALPVSGATQYQFRFRQPAEGFEKIRTSSSYHLHLLWGVDPLVEGSQYEVDVRAMVGGDWCEWGEICMLNIGTGPGMQGATYQNMAIDNGTGGEAELNMWPNPNRGDQLFLSLTEVPQGTVTVSVDIFDLYGKRVIARTIAVNDGFINTVLDLQGELSADMYMVNITAGEENLTQRLVIQR